MSKEVSRFAGEYEFLSNFYESEFVYEGRKYTTVEHAFQAAKCINDADKETIRHAKSPGQAKRLGRRVALRSDWESQKVRLMENILRVKFQNNDLRNLLDKTKDDKLVEGNAWHDNQWGNCTCSRHTCQRPGRNILGTLLMKIRDEALR